MKVVIVMIVMRAIIVKKLLYDYESEMHDRALSAPNYNVDRGLRRSARIRKPVQITNMYIASLLCVMCLMPSVYSLANMDPIIWQRMKNPVVEGIETVTTVINYHSPCNLFDEILIDKRATNDLKDWCESQFKSDFL